MRADDDLAVWTAPDSLATNLAELDDWLTYRYGIDLDYYTGSRACGGRRGCPPQTHETSLFRGQVAAPAPIPFDPSSSPVGAEGGGFGRPSSPSSPDPRQVNRGPVSLGLPTRARQAACLAAVGITSLALWRLISALLRRGN